MDINETLAHLRELPSQVAHETDAMTAARTVGDILTATTELEQELKEIRKRAVVELRAQGHTVRALAAELGLSPARIDQISKGKRA